MPLLSLTSSLASTLGIWLWWQPNIVLIGFSLVAEDRGPSLNADHCIDIVRYSCMAQAACGGNFALSFSLRPSVDHRLTPALLTILQRASIRLFKTSTSDLTMFR